MNEKQKAFCSKLYLLAVAGVGCEICFNLCKKMNIISVSKLVTAKINSNQRTAKPKKEGGKLGIACSAAGPRIAYSVDIVHKQGLKCLRAG